MKDYIKIVAYFNVFGTSIIGKKYLGLDAGKNHLEEYFCNQNKWSKARLKRTIKVLREHYIITKESSDGFADAFLSRNIDTMVKEVISFIEFYEKNKKDLVVSN